MIKWTNNTKSFLNGEGKIEMYYGHSMYGGWYAHDPAMENSLKAETLKALKVLAADNGCALAFRFDNI